MPQLLALADGDRARLLAAHRLRARLASAPRERAAALTDLADVLAAEREGLGEAVEVLERALGLDPQHGPAAGALARARLALDQPDQALALLEGMQGGVEGLPPRAVLDLELLAARALGDPALALERARRAARAAPMDAEIQEIWADAAESAEAHAEAAEAWTCALAADPRGSADEARRRSSLAVALGRAGRADEALREATLAAERAPEDAEALAAVAAALEGFGRLREALDFAERAARLEPERAAQAERLGRLLMAAVDSEGAPAPGPERPAAPAPPAEALGAALGDSHDAALRGPLDAALGDSLDAALGGPLDAALGDSLDAALDGAISAAMGAPTPAPDPAAQASASAALEQALAVARQSPFDLAALSALATACAAHPGDPRCVALGRVGAALTAFADPGRPAPSAPPVALQVTREQRAGAAQPASAGPTARLLALLAPWLEPLFPADVARRGVGPQHRVGPAHAPALELHLTAAGQALDARRVIAFLGEAGGFEIAIENTRPPALVVGGRLPREQRESAVDFALARALCLTDAGYALIGKFAPRDVGILCELAARFAGGQPPPLGLPEARAQSFLDALRRSVPPGIRERAAALGEPCAAELRGLAPEELILAIRRTAAREALLWSGDPLGALEALAAARRLWDPAAAGAGAARTSLLADVDLADLARFALSDLHLEVRTAAGATP
jgi:tetratricopeptide (TPR) repeat protein